MKTLIKTAVITALISGVIAALIAAYVSRPQPSIVITAIGFRGPLKGQQIELSDELITLTSASSSIDLRRFENFEKLLKTEQEISELLKALEQGIASVRAWDNRHESNRDDQSLTKPATEEHPLVNDDITANVLMNMITRGNLGEPPVRGDEAKKRKPLFDIATTQQKDAVTVFLGRRALRIKNLRDKSEAQQAQLRLYFQSLARGIGQKIRFYGSRFIDQAQTVIVEDRAIQDKLRAFLLPKSCISVDIVIHNAGKSSFTLRADSTTTTH
jgi:hypothetical protein